MAELNEYWSARAVEEYKDYLQRKIELDEEYYRLRSAPHVIEGAKLVQTEGGWSCRKEGEDTGITGYGSTPEEASNDFDRVWKGISAKE